MSAANLIYEGQRRRAQERSRREWNERTRNDPTSRAFQQRASMEDFRTNQMKDAENKRALALQEKKNKGLLGVANRNQEGALATANRRQIGETRRKKMTNTLNRDIFNSNATDRDRRFGLDRNNALFERFAKMQGLDSDGELGGVPSSAPGNTMAAWDTFKKNAGGLSRETLDLSIAKKLQNAKKNGIDIKEIDFTDGELSAMRGRGQGGNTTGRMDWIEGKDGRRRFFNERGNETAISTPKTPQISMKASHAKTDFSRSPAVNPSKDTRPVYGPQYRGSANPLGGAIRNKPISPNPFKFLESSNKSVNPRYR
jgi:hypothetical protein